MQSLVEKHSDLLDKIQISSDMFQCADCIVPATSKSVNISVIHNGIGDSTENNMCVNDNLLAFIWDRFRLALSCCIESLCDILGYHDETLRKNPLSLNKYLESLCSYSTKHLG